jgi:hypothetical protein
MLTPGVRSDESSEIKERYSSPRNPARFQLISKSNSQGCGHAKNWNPAGYWRSPATASLVDLFPCVALQGTLRGKDTFDSRPILGSKAAISGRFSS